MPVGDQTAIPARANFTKAQVAATCRVWGAAVGPLPPGVDGVQLLWAMSGVESSFGENCQPRFEPAYFTGGHYGSHLPMPALIASLGRAAACSYGPWQIMFCDAPPSYSPSSFDFIQACAQATVPDLNRKLRMFRPQTLAQIGDCWNAGHITPDPGYEAKLKAMYAVSMVNA